MTSRGGYLLMEVVLALGVASLVLGAVFSLASGALSISETIATEGRDQIQRETFLRFLGRNFEAMPGNAILDLKAEDSGSHFTSEMTFQNVPTAFGWAGQTISAEAVQLSTVLRRDGDLDVVLRYYEEAILDDADSTADVRADPVAEITLLRDVWRFEWRVLDGRTMEWDYEWDIRGRSPLQLELNVVFRRNGEEIVHYFWIPTKTSPETLMQQNRRPVANTGGTTGGGATGQPNSQPNVTLPGGGRGRGESTGGRGGRGKTGGRGAPSGRGGGQSRGGGQGGPGR